MRGTTHPFGQVLHRPIRRYDAPMQALAIPVHHPDVLSRAQESSWTRDICPADRTYLEPMPPAQRARHANFAAFVQRALDQAKLGRGWGVKEVAERSGIARSTVYRWRDGDWKQDPLPGQIVDFCDALDIPPGVAFGILWPGKSDVPVPAEPIPSDPDFRELLRRLEDPNVPDQEKYHIRATIRSLAARPATARRGRRQAS